MTSCELVAKAIEFGGPERVPAFFNHPPLLNDFCLVSISQPQGWNPEDGGRDEWGCVWETKKDRSMGQIKIHPLSSGWEALHTYVFPDLGNEGRYIAAKQTIARETQGRYILAGTTNMMFERLYHLRGFSNLLEDLYSNREGVEELADRIVELIITIIRQFAALGVHGVMASDDWGTQESLFINPALWREIFKPRYERLFRTAHEFGLHFFMHSCGYIYDIIGDLIECGLDVIQLDQPELLGVDRLSHDFGGKICFFCPVDIQQTLAKGSHSDIESEARHLMKALGSFEGGFIGKEYFPPEAIGVTQERNEVMYEAFLKYGRYPLNF